MSNNAMINKAAIYAYFGKEIPQDDEEDIISPDPVFVDHEEIAEPVYEDDNVAPPSAQPIIHPETPQKDYRHYGFLRTTIVLAVIVLAFALSAEQQDMLHLTIQNIVLYPWYPIVIIIGALGLLWYKSWIGKAMGGVIILVVVAISSYFELYDSLSINEPLQTSRAQSMRLSGTNMIPLQINDIISDISIDRGNNSVIDVIQSGERALGLINSKGTIVLSGSKIWNIVTVPKSHIHIDLPANKDLSIASKQLRANNAWNLNDLRISRLYTAGGILNQDISVPQAGVLKYITITSRWSDVDITIPEDIGIELQLDNRIDIKELADLEQIGTGVYRSKNFAQTDTHIRIRVDSVISSFTLHRD